MTDPFGFVAGTVGLALPLFQVAKKLRDQLRLVGLLRRLWQVNRLSKLYPHLAGGL